MSTIGSYIRVSLITVKVCYSEKHDSYTITITITTGGKITTVKGFRAKASNFVF